MKFAFAKTSASAIAFLFLLLPALTSCKKDDDKNNPSLKEQIVGEWEVKSFSLDGIEAMSIVILSSKMEFEAYTGNNGDFEWYIGYADGTSENQSGDYELDEADSELELENADGERLKLEVDLDGDELEISGISDGQRVVIKAERD